jgi:hypothetical protein
MAKEKENKFTQTNKQTRNGYVTLWPCSVYISKYIKKKKEEEL